jgi:uncharacterized protein GlcG (DUF336 family)
LGSGALFKRSKTHPSFVEAMNALAGGAAIGAVGVTGDTSDNDETSAVAGICAAGLDADPG